MDTTAPVYYCRTCNKHLHPDDTYRDYLAGQIVHQVVVIPPLTLDLPPGLPEPKREAHVVEPVHALPPR